MTKENKSIPEVWLAFALKTIELDNNSKKNSKNRDPKWEGWHWLWAVHRLKDEFQNFNVNQLGKQFDGTRSNTYQPFPKASSEPDYFEDTLQNLIKDLGYPKKISKIDFSGLTITEDIDFSSFIFILETSFAGTKFLGNATFTDAEFLRGADFNKVILSKSTNFNKVKFHSKVNFSEAEILNINFDKAEFAINYWHAEFNYTKFWGMVSFKDTIFYRNAGFSHAEFAINYWQVEFSGAKFSSLVSFSNVKFSSGVSFKKAIFSNFTYFDNVEFFGNDKTGLCGASVLADFSEAKFSGSIKFNNTNFSGDTLFYNTEFLSYTTFENANFKFYAPKFYGAVLNDEMFWTDIKLPKFEKMDDIETKERYKKRIKDNENAYENLSTKLGNQKKYRDEHFFFRQEMSCQRDLAESITSGLAFRLYGIFSDYGYRIGRAVWCWFGHMVFWAGILFFFGFKDTATTSQKIACSALTSVSNAHSFLLSKGERLDDCYEMASNKTIFNLFWAGETILGVAFLFLVLLTLRVRFRLK